MMVKIVIMRLVTEMSKYQESHSFEMVIKDVEVIINFFVLKFIY